MRHEIKRSIQDISAKKLVPITASAIMAANDRAVLKLKLPESTR